ncbi:MAG: SDR family oxidoreductase [Myxococcota bacterium]
MTKTAVVVGATGNIGKAVCQILREAGYAIDPTWLGAERPDATQKESYLNLPPKIDFALYLAGINHISKAEILSDEDWDKVHDVNLKGAFLFAKAAFPSLKQAPSSSFVTISSIMVTHPYPNRLAYATAKAGLEAMTRVLAVEWGSYNISTHCLRLGHMNSLMKSTSANPALLAAARQLTPTKQLIEPSSVAKYILWLAEGGCKSISGSVLDFDPAYTINRWPL